MLKFLIRLSFLIFGPLVLIQSVGLSIARHTEPPSPDWLIFSDGVLNSNGLNDYYTNLYRVLSDGSHLKKIGQFPANIQIQCSLPSGILVYRGSHQSFETDYFWRHINARHSHHLFTWTDSAMEPQIVRCTQEWLYLSVQLKDSEELWRVHLKTGEKQVIKPPDESAIRWAFLGDERILYWIASEEAFGVLGDLYITRLDGTIEQNLTNLGKVERYAPHIDVPGWIYFLNRINDENSTLYRIRPDGSDEGEIARDIAFGAVIPIEPPSGHTSQWIHYQGAYGGPYYRVPIDGGEAVEIPRPFYAANDYTHDLQFSPDGEWVYFTVLSREVIATDLLRVHTMTGEVQLVVEYGQSPIWSSDSQWIIYLRTGENDFNDLYRAKPDGSDAELIPEYITGPLLLAEDGNLLVYNAYGTKGVYLAALNLSTFENRIFVEGPFKTLELKANLPVVTIRWDAEWVVLLIGVLYSLIGLSGFVLEGNAIFRRVMPNPS